MSENANKPGDAKKPLDAELFEGEARPAEEVSQYGDETDTPLRRKKAPDKKKILIYAHYYDPDVASTGQILQDLAEGMLSDFDATVDGS